MPDRVIRLNGVEHHFPGDATDDEIRVALDGDTSTSATPSIRAATPPGRVGLFTSPLAPEFAKAQAGLEEATHPGLTTPVWRARLQGLLSGMASGAGNVIESATTPASAALSLATAGALRIPAVGTLARTPISVPGLTRAAGRALKTYDITKPAKPIGEFLEWLATPTTPTAGPLGPPKVVGKAPTLTEALSAVLEDMRSGPSVPETPVAPAVSGAPPGGEQAAADTMRLTQERGPLAKRTIPPKPVASTVGSPTVVGKAPTLTEALQAVLDEIRTTPSAETPVAPTVPGAAPEGGRAAADTMRRLAEQPSLSKRLAAPTKPAARPPTETVDPIVAMRFRELTRKVIQTPAEAEEYTRLAAIMKGEARDVGMSYAARGTVVGQRRPRMSVSAAIKNVRQAAKAASMTPTGAQTKAAIELVRQGESAADTIQAINVIEALRESPSFTTLPTAEEVEAVVAAKNVGKGDVARRRARQKAVIEEGGNPFR